MFFFGFCKKLCYKKTRSDKKERNYITFLTELASKTEDIEQKRLLTEKATELAQGKDEEYLKIEEKDKDIFVGDE